MRSRASVPADRVAAAAPRYSRHGGRRSSCSASPAFAVVLRWAADRRRRTIEVAIFQAVRFDFDLSARRSVRAAAGGDLRRAGRLPGSALHAVPLPRRQGLRRAGRPDRTRRQRARCSMTAVCWRWAAFVGLPILAVLIHGLHGPVTQVLGEASLWRAVATQPRCSPWERVRSASSSEWGLSDTLRHLRFRRYAHRRAAMMETGGSLMLVVPPLALGTGLLCCCRRSGCAGLGAAVRRDHQCLPLPALRAAQPGGADAADHASAMTGWRAAWASRGSNRLRLVEWPVLRRPLGRAARAERRAGGRRSRRHRAVRHARARRRCRCCSISAWRPISSTRRR